MAKVYNQNLIKKLKILVVAPHADDEILGCGGSILRHLTYGDIVNVIICTNANKGYPEKFTKKIIQNIRIEAKKAHKVLGSINTIFLDFPAPNLDIFPESQISDTLSTYFSKIKPDILYIPSNADLHNDHKKIHQACIVASRTRNNLNINKILSYEVLSETDLNFSSKSLSFTPNYFVDISNFIELKIKAMKCYKSQLQIYPNSRTIECINALSIYRGAGVGLNNAEAFMVNRIINE